MDFQQKKKLISFIQQELGKPFQWGFTDCNTFVLRGIDSVLETTYSWDVVGKYWDQKGAVFFQWNRWGTEHAAEKFLKDIGARIVSNRKKIQTGDIILVDCRRWQAVYLYIEPNVISADRIHGVVSLPLSILDNYHIKIMRVF